MGSCKKRQVGGTVQFYCAPALLYFHAMYTSILLFSHTLTSTMDDLILIFKAAITSLCSCVCSLTGYIVALEHRNISLEGTYKSSSPIPLLKASVLHHPSQIVVRSILENLQ